MVKRSSVASTNGAVAVAIPDDADDDDGGNGGDNGGKNYFEKEKKRCLPFSLQNEMQAKY